MKNTGSSYVKKISVLILCLSILFLIPSCGYRTRYGRVKNCFRLGFQSTPTSLNPYKVGDSSGRMALSLIYDTLFYRDIGSGEIKNGLCDSYSYRVKDDGSWIWTVDVKSDALWHDGEKVTAEDIIFTLQSMVDFSSCFSVPQGLYFDTVGIAENNEYSLSFITWAGPGIILNFLAEIPLLPKHIWNDYFGYNYSGLPKPGINAEGIPFSDKMLVGSGPYMLEKISEGCVSLTRNEKYRNDDGIIEKVQLFFGLDSPLLALKQGTIDAVAECSAAEYAEALADSIPYSVSAPGDYEFIAINFSPDFSFRRNVTELLFVSDCLYYVLGIPEDHSSNASVYTGEALDMILTSQNNSVLKSITDSLCDYLSASGCTVSIVPASDLSPALQKNEISLVTYDDFHKLDLYLMAEKSISSTEEKAEFKGLLDDYLACETLTELAECDKAIMLFLKEHAYITFIGRNQTRQICSSNFNGYITEETNCVYFGCSSLFQLLNKLY